MLSLTNGILDVTMTMQFDRSKLRAVILNICGLCPREMLGAVKLHKVLYFLDMMSYAQSGLSVTGSTYCKRPFGPTCVQLLPMLRDMSNDGDIEIRDVEFYGRSKKEYIPRAVPIAGTLNGDEIALLEEVVDFVCNQNTAQSISDYSHQLPWEMAEFGEVIPYSTALMLFPADIGPEAFELVRKGAQEIAKARLNENTVDMSLLAALRSRIQLSL
jgi:Protein of unknown function (DUF4065)